MLLLFTQVCLQIKYLSFNKQHPEWCPESNQESVWITQNRSDMIQVSGLGIQPCHNILLQLTLQDTFQGQNCHINQKVPVMLNFLGNPMRFHKPTAKEMSYSSSSTIPLRNVLSTKHQNQQNGAGKSLEHKMSAH